MSGTEGYKVGYGKPPLETRFGAGNNANPSGKTSEQKRLEYANAEAAMRIRARLLEAVERNLFGENITPGEADKKAMDMVEAAMLKLLKDSEDRGLGAPVQPVDHTSTDRSMSPAAHQDAVLAALRAKHAAKPE